MQAGNELPQSTLASFARSTGKLACPEVTPSVIACGDATFPKGTAFGDGGKVYGTAQRRPLGGAGERSETEGVPRSAALSQKAALQLPFSSTTPPVKIAFGALRRARQTRNLK